MRQFMIHKASKDSFLKITFVLTELIPQEKLVNITEGIAEFQILQMIEE